MLFLFIVLCANMRACVCVCACLDACMFIHVGPLLLRLDCSHPPIHPIATIATDGAAGINAPGSASLINGRLTKPLTSVCRDSDSSHPNLPATPWVLTLRSTFFCFFQLCCPSLLLLPTMPPLHVSRSGRTQSGIPFFTLSV